MQATQRRRVLLVSLAICSWDAPKAWSVLCSGTLCRTRWPRMSRTCSIGDGSGDRAGQSRRSTLFCCKNCYSILARLGLVLSSCSTFLVMLNKRQNNRLQHFIDVALACQNYLRGQTDIPRHTIRLPPTYRPCSTAPQFAYLSPLRHQTRRLLLSMSSRNYDLSVKSTVAHCWLVHQRCCLVHAILACH